MYHLSGFYLVFTSSSLEHIPKPALLPDDGSPQISGLPAVRVPEAVTAPREPLHPQRRGVERETHP